MAEIVPVLVLVRARRREREQQLTERCVEILELNLRFTLDLFDRGDEEHRTVYARRLRRLSELLEYAVQRL